MSFFGGKGKGKGIPSTVAEDDVAPSDSISQIGGNNQSFYDARGVEENPLDGVMEEGEEGEPQTNACVRCIEKTAEIIDPNTRFQIVSFAVTFVVTLTFSLPSSFMFDDAERMGQNDKVTSVAALFVYSSYGATAFLCAPLHGIISSYIGRKTVIMVCLALCSASTIAFGLATHRILLLACRLLQGVGASGVQSAAAALLADHQKDKNNAGAFARFQLATGFSMVIGPPFGGLVYNIFGKSFVAPFLVVGIIMGVQLFIIPWFMPTEKVGHRFHGEYMDTCRLLIHQRVWYLSCATLLGVSAFAFLAVTLATHLKNYLELENSTVHVAVTGYFAVVFLGFALACLGLAPIYNRWPQLETFIVTMGMLLLAAGFMFVGPLPWKKGAEFEEPILKNIVMATSLLVVGAGSGAVLLPTAPGLIMEAIPQGGVAIGIMSAVWTACINLAQLMGPMYGQISVELVDFPVAAVGVAGMCVMFVIVFSIVAVLVSLVQSRKEESYEQVAQDGLNESLLDAHNSYFTAAPSEAPTSMTRNTRATNMTRGTMKTAKTSHTKLTRAHTTM